MPSFPSDPDDETLRSIMEALADAGQAVSIYDAEDNLRYANTTYRGMFLKGYEGPFTFTDILRYGAANGLGVRIDDGDVEALIARTLPRRRSSRRKSFETDLLDGRWFWIEAGNYRSKAAFAFVHILQTLAESGHGQPTPIVTIPTQ